MDLAESLVPTVDEGMGNSAYVLDVGDGRALAVDPSLDLRGVRAIAAKRGLRIAYAAETHLHADFLSGARQLAVDHEAQILASAAGRRTFPHTRLDDGDEVDLGGLTLRARCRLVLQRAVPIATHLDHRRREGGQSAAGGTG
jgi:glyoxylase-like metal-dependent hydrolase (beta-lactamase superfamily II)